MPKVEELIDRLGWDNFITMLDLVVPLNSFGNAFAVEK